LSDFLADYRSSPEVLEKAALGFLARRKDGNPFGALRRAASSSGAETGLGCLVDPTASLPSATPELRAQAIWGLIVDEIGRLGAVVEPREHFVLLAAFCLPPVPDGSTAWAPNLGDRFRQLAGVRGLFGAQKPLSNTPMNKAWASALGMLAAAVAARIEHLDGEGWLPYVDIGRAATAGTQPDEGSPDGCRMPSEGAQPVFVERMLVTVVMHRRMALRRITERDIVARKDGVDGYDVQALTGWAGNGADIPVKAIWNCRLSASSAPVRLRFRRKLKLDEPYHFVSEAIDGQLGEERKWISVTVDHHGVAQGGLTIRVNFDEDCLPEACWWYAEQLEAERLRRPPVGSPRLLDVGDGFVQHTFAGYCHPREEYGIAFCWPRR
jgi:hypothetical protein